VRTTLIEPFSVLAKSSSSYVAIPHPAVVVDSKGIISQVNRAAEEHSGRPAHQLIHKPVHDFFHPSTLSEKNCELCTAIKQGRSLENHIVLFPKKRQWFLTSLAPINVGDKNSGMVQSLTDITQRKIVEKELIALKEKTEENERKFKAITNQSTEGITVADPEGNYTFVNDTFCKMMGYSEEELLQMTVFDMKAPEQDTSSFERSKNSEEGMPVQVTLQRKDGTTFISEVIGKRIEIQDRDQVLGTIRDITRQVEADARLIKSEKNLAEAQQVAQLGCWELDLASDELTWSDEIFRIFGIDADKFKPSYEAFIEAVHPEDRELVEKAYKNSLQNREPYTLEHRLLMKDGSIKTVSERCETTYDIEGKPVRSIGTVLDITHRKQQEEQILHQAHFDSLTDLPNRFLALDRLTQLLNDARRNDEKVAVLFLDLDDFKKVNDTLGHETGDKLLIEAAQRLRSVSRVGDTVGRLGGDEFIMLLGGLKRASDASPIAENLLDRFKDSFNIDDRNFILTTSIGISIFPDDGKETSELLRNADSAMYHAKELGRNTYSYFTPTMNREVTRRLVLEEQIHDALNRNEFTVLYQPQVIISNGKIISAEALLRWNNPSLGSISPEEFIPIAEQTGLIVPLGQFVLAEALKTVAKWQQSFDDDIRIAVNLSPRQFRDPELVSLIEKNLKQAGVPGKSLELEITEGVLMSGHTHIDDALTALSNMGICISMDDFGIGYSSLSYLRKYPFDVLKIDRSFINDITEDVKDRELISATIAMAHSLKLKVVAEGVETEEQLVYLKQLGCDFGQGYLFSKPATAETIAELFKKQKQK
ncbi:MAG: EAL domain-containing protein, partial [Gammaproteobacteria bacterium]|nr:EAL domain-containing protein [Gammaproteobacteria bacterium]